jgi:hypothetical protein
LPPKLRGLKEELAQLRLAEAEARAPAARPAGKEAA